MATSEEALWQYFRDVRAAVEAANQGKSGQPYAGGTFMVSALSGDVELTVSDVSEEDAVLIASELKEMGVKAIVRGTRPCPHCGMRVPEQDYCVNCRGRLGR